MSRRIRFVDTEKVRWYGDLGMRWWICLFAILWFPSRTVEAAPFTQTVSPEKPIQVVVTLPVLKDFVEQIGKEQVAVKSLLSGLENQHAYTSSPSDILAIQKARLLAKVGLGLDVWTEGLIANAQNPRLLVLTTSTGVPLIKGKVDRESRGPGNPHIWLDPENAKVMIRHITEALIKLDPASKSFYLKNQAAYFKDLDNLKTRLIRKARILRNRKIITHHDAWPYFARRFGFDIRGHIIPQAGTEPSARHIADLIRIIKHENIKVIVSEPQLNPRFPQILAEETGARVIVLTPIPGLLGDAETYYSMIKYDIETLVSALQE